MKAGEREAGRAKTVPGYKLGMPEGLGEVQMLDSFSQPVSSHFCFHRVKMKHKYQKVQASRKQVRRQMRAKNL